LGHFACVAEGIDGERGDEGGEWRGFWSLFAAIPCDYRQECEQQGDTGHEKSGEGYNIDTHECL
jgi:hypothetical protein